MGQKRVGMKTMKGGKLKRDKKNDFSSLTNQDLLVCWLGRHGLNRQSRLALKKEMKVRRVTTGGFYTL